MEIDDLMGETNELMTADTDGKKSVDVNKK